MANVRKVTHESGAQAWRATITTLEGKRKSKNFPRKGDADAWVKANDGAATTGSSSMTMLQLAASHNRWFDGLVLAGERGQVTSDGYDSQMRNHLKVDTLAGMTLAAIDAPAVQGFLDRIIERTGSVDTARRVKKSLSAWAEHGIRNGWLRHNPVDGTKVIKKRRRNAERRIQIPEKSELVALLAAAKEGPTPERDSAMVHLLMFAGVRISEILGAADDAVDLRRPGTGGRAGGVLSVVERLCSRYVTLGEVKTEGGLRDIPLGPATASAVRAWRVARGPSPAATFHGQRVVGRLFPKQGGTRQGPFWAYTDFRRQCWEPLLMRAGLAESVKTGAHVRIRPAFGPHTLRHVFASIQIENGVTPKRLQTMLGHASLAMTMDLYGHLWTDPAGDQLMAEAGERTITSLS